MSTQFAAARLFTIARMMIVVASFGFVALGVRHFQAANEPDQSGGELIELFLALRDIAVGGCVCGFGLRTACGGRFAAVLRPWRRWLTLGAAPVLLLFFVLIDSAVLGEVVWGTTCFSIPCVRIMCFEIDVPALRTL